PEPASLGNQQTNVGFKSAPQVQPESTREFIPNQIRPQVEDDATEELLLNQIRPQVEDDSTRELVLDSIRPQVEDDSTRELVLGNIRPQVEDDSTRELVLDSIRPQVEDDATEEFVLKQAVAEVEDTTREFSLSNLGFKGSGERLSPGVQNGAEDSSPKSIPPAAMNGGDELSVIEANSEELWARGSMSAPGMGIMRRKLPMKSEYQPLHQIRTGHESGLSGGLCPKQKHLISCGKDEKVCIWNVKTGELEHRFRIDERGASAVGFLSDGNIIYALGRDRHLHIWLLPQATLGESSRVMHTSLTGHEDEITCGVVHPRGKHLLTGSRDGTTRLWSIQDGQCVAVLAGQDIPVVGVTYGVKGPVTASEDGRIRIWNQQGFQVDQIEVSGDLLSIDGAKGMLCWTQSSGAVHAMHEGKSRSRRLWGHYGEARSVDFRGDGCFATAGEDGRILLYEPDGEKPFQEIQLPAPISSVTFEDRFLAAACEGGAVYLFKRQSGKANSTK
ncbi:MAG: WD40 repeat domain-containing protein, partial [Bradymonadaceae bacterium]